MTMSIRANVEQFICAVCLLSVVDGFSTTSLLQRIPPSSPINNNNIHQPSTYYHHHNNNNILLHQSKIIDVEVIPNEEPDSSSSSPSTTNNPSTLQNEEEELNLIQYSQNQDPEWKSMPISYCDIVSNAYIDCNLVFYVKDPSFKDKRDGGKDGGAGASGYEGAEYALGVPTEIPIVVALELDEDDNDEKSSNKGGTNTVNLNKVLPINHDLEDEVEGSMTEEEKEEIFQLAARAIQTEYGKSIRMKKTPRVLTLEGELDEIIGNWKDVLLGNNNNKEKKEEISIDDALNVLDEDDDNEEEDYFDKIMRRDLGDDYMSLLDDDDDDEELDAKLLKLFDNSAISDDEESLDTLLNEINTQESQYKETTYNDLIQQLQPSAALKLLNFIGPNNKEYTILKPLRPILLIGKEDPSDYTRRILLTEEERRVILPRLEKSCRDGLEEAGYFLDGGGSGSGSSKLGV